MAPDIFFVKKFGNVCLFQKMFLYLGVKKIMI